MPKERSVNPAQAQRKAEKARAIKKGKAEAQARRNEKLARRNPDRLQKQIEDLKAIESSGGKLTSHEKIVLEGLEKEIKEVRKARESLGDAAPRFGSGRGGFSGSRGGRGGGVLGKRRRDEEDSSDSDIPDDVKEIPMPRDTPPPIPKEILDQWYQKRRERNGYTSRRDGGQGENANMTPLGQRPDAPKVEPKTVYEAKPIIRNLRKEAVSAFVPAAVRMKMEKAKGNTGLIEPEEADRLEQEGYMRTVPSTEQAEESMSGGNSDMYASKNVTMEEVEDEEG
ncbi:WW domain binding protein 11-domain-containing protein [Xylogone sp. PMI_703]|nr:WW domain binding protein 11-domain-containing protein [Xylogone sp. PMI_703]